MARVTLLWSLLVLVTLLTASASVSAAGLKVAQGTVTDADTGDPIKYAQLELGYYNTGTGQWMLDGSDCTLADGVYELYDVFAHGAGEYKVFARAPKYVSQETTASWDGSSTLTIDFELEPAKEVAEGTITDADTGDPIEEASVQLYYHETESSEWLEVHNADTHVDGTYVLYDEMGYGAGEYKFLADASGHEPQETITSWDGSSTLTVDFELELSDKVVQGTVTDADTGDPLEGAWVELYYYDAAHTRWLYEGYTYAGANGAYALVDEYGFGVGTYRCEASASGYISQEEVGSWDGTTTLLMDFALEPDYSYDTTPPVTTSDVMSEPYPGLATITLTATDVAGSGVADTHYELDGSATVTYTAPIEVGDLGEHTIVYWSVDKAGNTESKNTETFRVDAAEKSFVVIAGTTRYTTAVEASKHAYESGAATVIVATGVNWPDALGGAALAGAVDGPLLLTTKDAVPSAVLDEIDRLGATDAYILGGEGAVSKAVEDTLDSKLSGTVTRLWGANRYGTADAVADEVIELAGASFSGNAYIATGANFPDALGASPLAASSVTPILLAPIDGTPHIPAEVDSAVILGGEGAVTAKTEADVKATLGAANVDRIGGADRYETAAMIAEHGVAEGMHWDGVGIATGAAFPDALSGGAMLGSIDSVLLLTPPTTLASAAQERLADNKDAIDTVHYIGGTGAVSQGVRDEVQQSIE